MGHKLKSAVAASELAKWCGLRLVGADFSIYSVAPLSSHEDGVLCFAKNIPDKAISDRSVLIANEGAAEKSACVLVAVNPRLEFARALSLIDQNIGFERSFTAPIIDSTAEVSSLSYIAPGVKIGARSIISPFVFIGEGTIIGDDCIVKAGAVIGQDGFGFERDEMGLPIRIPHLGFVEIGNCVEVGSLTTVCRGTLGNTVIKNHAKIDDHVHVAHNVRIGEGVMVVAGAGLCGGVVLEKGSWIGPNSNVIQHKRIGARAFVGIGANVLQDVPDGVTVAGYPARVLPSKV